MATDIEELKELIEKERASQERIREAKAQADNILKNAREEAELILRTAESEHQWDELKQAAEEALSKEKGTVDEDYERQVSSLETSAKQNFERAVAHVIDAMLRVKL